MSPTALCVCAGAVLALNASLAATASSTSVNFGDISHQRLGSPLADQIIDHLRH